ncbi:hypothetical protein C8J56DRAFT_941385 [Mycena floridula]|nr:hypothetical protein C8J56DRAFT_941385 [Mycena floridula]
MTCDVLCLCSPFWLICFALPVSFLGLPSRLVICYGLLCFASFLFFFVHDSLILPVAHAPSQIPSD